MALKNVHAPKLSSFKTYSDEVSARQFLDVKVAAADHNCNKYKLQI